GDPIDPVPPLVRSTGAEVGVRSSGIPGLRSTLSLWTIELDSELRFIGDTGTTEPSDPSRRIGVTLANYYRAEYGLTADLDVSFTQARTLDVPAGQDLIPGALENVIAAGIGYVPEGNGPLGAFRLRHFGSYPLVDDDSERARASSLLNLNLGYRLGGASLDVSILNLLDEEHSDIQYFYTSRLAGEPAGGVDDVHFHPAEPRQLRVSLSWGL
ncbi:MAG TPA: TonB-dependent receptor, partial [Longimicrobiales bacterium]|nr:TonB-dependent receptor [Longimicrobiales bacterium]